MEYRICPSIIAGDFTKLPQQVKELNSAGCVHLHMDVMDGNFVPQITFGSKLLQDYRKIWQGTLDAHLMVDDPKQQLELMLETGVDLFHLHIEFSDGSLRSGEELQSLIDLVLSRGKKVSLAVDGPTQDLSLVELLVPSLESVLIATGKVGKAGQPIDLSTLDKVRQLREQFPELNLMVDIGINPETLLLALEAGANWFVASSAIFKHPGGVVEGYSELKMRSEKIFVIA